MTEEEWLMCIDLTRILTCLQPRPSDRKLRLASVALSRRLKPVLLDRVQDELAVAERVADGLATEKEHEDAYQQVANKLPHASVLYPLGGYLRFSDIDKVGDSVLEGSLCMNDDEERVAHAQLLRDIFVNPFRPVTADPAWFTSTVVAIAKGMYESRDFGAMPILADALQDAGCDNDEVLQHCRDANGTHVRGCWVVDLVLGKT